jgi:hypothetical protein
MFTVEYDEDTDQFCVVKWGETVNDCRTGDTIAKFNTIAEAEQCCADHNSVADYELTADVGCEFDN